MYRDETDNFLKDFNDMFDYEMTKELSNLIDLAFESDGKSVASKKWYIDVEQEKVGELDYTFEFNIYSSKISKPIYIRLNYNSGISNGTELVDYIIDDTVSKEEIRDFNELRKELLIKQKEEDIKRKEEMLNRKNKQEKERRKEEKKIKKEQNIKQFKKEQKLSNPLEQDIVF